MGCTAVSPTAAVGVYLILAATAPAQAVPGPSARCCQSMAYDARREVVVLFGGYDGVALGDTWEWDGRAWAQRSPAASPSPRSHAAMAYDASRGTCVLYGGYSAGGIDQTWEWDGTSWAQRSLGQTPGPRFYHSMVYDDARQVCVVFGGFDGSANLGDTWEYDGATWLQRSATGPSARRSHGMAFRTSTGEAVLFGGFGSSHLSDTWTWDGVAWTQRTPQNLPPARSTHALAYDPVRDRVVLFGGETGRSRDDTWTWDGTDWSVSAARFPPPSRLWVSGQLVFDDRRGECVLFGGTQNTASHLGDTWVFDGSEWRQKLDYAISPVNGHRYARIPPMTWPEAEGLAALEGGHLATIRSAEENAWVTQNLVAGRTYIGFSDVGTEGQWVWSSGESETYTNWASPPDNYGNGQDYATMLPGGSWDDVCPFGSCVWPAVIELPGGRTGEVSSSPVATTSPPSSVDGATVAGLPQAGALLFGNAGALPMTYELLGSDWIRQTPSLSPSARRDHSLILDPARADNVLFGGESPTGTHLGDTWTYADGQWALRSPAVAPPARAGHAMAFDPSANIGLLFGGADASNTALADMWSWNGFVWSQVTPTTLPPARRGHRMSFDALRGRIVLFGGSDGVTLLDDVWEWDGTDWTDVTPSAAGSFYWGPTARESFAMAYDPRAERVVLHGGEDGSGCVDDFWSWDGIQWTRLLSGSTTPSPRRRHAMVLDRSVGELRLFGGGCAATTTQDVWRIEPAVPPRTSVYGIGCAGTSGTPALDAQPGSRPVLGETFAVDLTNLPISPVNVPFAVTGFSRTLWAGGALPVDLAILGMPGCQLLTSSEDTVTLSNRLGRASVSLTIPNSRTLLGNSLFMQGAVFDRFANAQGIVMSNGLELRIGDR